MKKYSLLALCLSLLLLVALVLPGCGETEAEPVELNVSAAASLTDAITEANDAYMAAHANVTLVTNLASSGTLQKQIEQGAPADVFLSAGAKQMQALEDQDLLLEGTRVNWLNNRVVLVVPVNSNLTFSSFNDLVNDNVLQIAIGDWESVPAGTYGKQALDQLGIFEAVEDKLILCSDVRQVLSYVEAGNVDAGIVYATDAAISDKVKIMADAPVEVNSKIVYPAAIIKSCTQVEAARAYLDYLFSDEARMIFEKYGFTVVQK